MAADDIQTINTPTGGASDALLLPGLGAPVSADTVERWARAVTAPLAHKEQNADTPAALAKPESPQSAPVDRPPGSVRLDALAQPVSSASPEPGRGDAQSLPDAPFSAQSSANDLLADARATGASSAWTLAATSPRAPANQQAAFSAADPAGTDSTMPAPVAPSAITARLSPVIHTPADASFTVRGAPKPMREPAVRLNSDTPTTDNRFAGTAEPALMQQPVFGRNEFPSSGHNDIAGLGLAVPSHSDDQGDQTATARTSPSALAQNEVAGARALPLSALRDLHATHRQNRFDAALLNSTPSESAAPQPSNPTVNADLMMGRVHHQPFVDAGSAAEGVGAVSGNERLHALIESCCSRLWVNEGGSRAAQGVMLDLGRWMPGCTVEIAKAVGVLRITLRGVEGSERARLEDELQGLGDGLADKLGCKVVAAVATNKELT